jgi:predicted RNase H-like nuclease (RuvC/YqgF family)
MKRGIMNKTRDLIIRLKAVREEKGYSLNDIVNLVEENGDFISRSSIQRVFADGSEDSSFRYEDTIRPIAKALLDIEKIEDDDSLDVATLKALLKYKIQRIEDLENQLEHLQAALDNEKLKRHEKIDDIRNEYEKKIDFLKDQITLKDKRMDLLLEALLRKENTHVDNI